VSDPIDIKALDEYLKGGSDISQRYRELGREDVSPELDRRVLDEARTAVAGGGGGRSRSWLRWGAPVALAASVVLAVTVVIESGPQNDSSLLPKPAAVDKVRPESQRQVEQYELQDQLAQQPQQQRPAFAPEPTPPAALAKTESERLNSLTPEEVTVDAKALREQSSATLPVAVDSAAVDSPAPQLAAEQPTPSFAGSVASTPAARKEVAGAPAEADSSDDDLSSISITGTTRARRAGRGVGPRDTISGSAVSRETRPAADEDAERADPQKWLEEIRELRRSGKVVEADRAWEQFREAFPKFPVADDDIARKK
jgi:hypothetical protein